ncbi:unnamed protein product, partial [marine sediment metagenome]
MHKGEKQTKPQFDILVNQLSDVFLSILPRMDIPQERMQTTIKSALVHKRFIDDLSELYRLEPKKIFTAFKKLDISEKSMIAEKEKAEFPSSWCASLTGIKNSRGLSITAYSPKFNESFRFNDGALEKIETEWRDLVRKIQKSDPFLSYYRLGISKYLRYYLSHVSPLIRNFVADRFKKNNLKYLVTVGIGANEQFWHFPQKYYQYLGETPEWYICDNPKDLIKLPAEVSTSNTLFIEFSRSGKSQEVVKFDEFLPYNSIRIVFTNKGPLYRLSKRYGKSCLRIEFPEEIPGRFGKNMTPLLMVPLDLLGLPLKNYWEKIINCIKHWDLKNSSSPPVALARY